MNTRNETPAQEDELSLATREEVPPESALRFGNALYGWFPAAVKQLYQWHGLPYADDYYDFEQLFADHLKVVKNPLSLLATLVVLDSKCHLKMNHDMLQPVLLSTIDEIKKTNKTPAPITEMTQLMSRLAPKLSSDAVSLLLAQLHKFYFLYRHDVNYPSLCREVLASVGLSDKYFTDVLLKIQKHRLVSALNYEETFLKGFYLTMVYDGYFKPNCPFAGDLSPRLMSIVAGLDERFVACLKNEETHQQFLSILFDLEQGYLLRHYFLYSQLSALSHIQYNDQPALRGQLYRLISTLYQTGLGPYFVDVSSNNTWKIRIELLRAVEGFIKLGGKETVDQTLAKINELAYQYFLKQGFGAAEIEKAPNLVNFVHARSLMIHECNRLLLNILIKQQVETREKIQHTFSENLKKLNTEQMARFLAMMKVLCCNNTSFSLIAALNIVVSPSCFPLFKAFLKALDKTHLLARMEREDFTAILPALDRLSSALRPAFLNDEEKLEQLVHLVLTEFVDRLLQSGRCDVNDVNLQALCNAHFIDLDFLTMPLLLDDEGRMPLDQAVRKLIDSDSEAAEKHSTSHETSAAKRLRIA